MVSQLRKRLAGCNTDTGWNSDPAAHSLPYLLAQLSQVEVIESRQVDETFINGIDFLPWTELANHCHHALRHVRYRDGIGREATMRRHQDRGGGEVGGQLPGRAGTLGLVCHMIRRKRKPDRKDA